LTDQIAENDRIWGKGNWVQCNRCLDSFKKPSYHHKDYHLAEQNRDKPCTGTETYAAGDGPIYSFECPHMSLSGRMLSNVQCKVCGPLHPRSEDAVSK
jgi:hypothetical protein